MFMYRFVGRDQQLVARTVSCRLTDAVPFMMCDMQRFFEPCRLMAGTPHLGAVEDGPHSARLRFGRAKSILRWRGIFPTRAHSPFVLSVQQVVSESRLLPT